MKSGWLRAIFATIGLLVAPALASAEDFRIESKVYLTQNGKAQLVSDNLTLFSQGVVYDFLRNHGEVTVLDPRPSRSRMIVMDPKRKVKTEVAFKDIDAFIAKIRKAALDNDEAFVQFLGNPKFEEHFDQGQHELKLTSDWMRYQLTTVDAPSADVRRRYREFSNWYAKLNCMAQPLSLPPFARLKVNEHLDRLQQIPVEVELTIFLQKQLQVRSEHKVTWQLIREDVPRIREANQQYQDFRLVSFAEYYEQTPEQAQGPQGPKRK